MSVLIEDQILQFLIEQEEIRCKIKEEGTGKKVTRRTIVKPWNRPGKKALCQEYDFLLMIDEYDYDLSISEIVYLYLLPSNSSAN